MRLITGRFGKIELDAGEIILFPDGIHCARHTTHWTLLADAADQRLYWLQSVPDADVALPLVDPRAWVPVYRPRPTRSQLGGLAKYRDETFVVLARVFESSLGLAINLKTPILIHPPSHEGRHVVLCDEHPVQYVISDQAAILRKVA